MSKGKLKKAFTVAAQISVAAACWGLIASTAAIPVAGLVLAFKLASSGAYLAALGTTAAILPASCVPSFALLKIGELNGESLL